MIRRKRKAQQENPFTVVLDFAEAVDALFTRYSGKTIGAWLKEPGERPKELPRGGEMAAEPGLPLAVAYAVMGLPRTASLDEIKRRYRDLARMFHPDSPGGYREAMVLLNRAHESILEERKGS